MRRITSVFRYSFLVLQILAIVSLSASVNAQNSNADLDVSGEASVVVIDNVDGTSELQYFIIDNINRRETRIFSMAGPIRVLQQVDRFKYVVKVAQMAGASTLKVSFTWMKEEGPAAKAVRLRRSQVPKPVTC